VFPTSLTCICRNETFTFAAGSFTPKVYVWIHDHKTLGKDKLLGEGEIDVGPKLVILFAYLTRRLRSGDTFNQRAYQEQTSPLNCRVAV
jgi:hypothetical protein